MAQRLAKTVVAKGGAWSAGRPERRGVLALAGDAAWPALLAWAWWPAGQYQPVRASDDGTLLAAARLVSAPVAASRPQPPSAAQVAAAPVKLKPGKHLAVALIPEGGATKEHPAVFVIKGGKGQKPVVLVSDRTPRPQERADRAGGVGRRRRRRRPTASPAPTRRPGAELEHDGSDPVKVAAFNFALPDKPRANDSQALAVNHEDGGIKYSVAYSLVTVTGGQPVDSRNTAYAFANCNACTTVAVSFQLVLVVGQSDTIAPLNFAGALNVNCPSCITTAIADQIVLSIKSVPSDELLQRLNDGAQEARRDLVAGRGRDARRGGQAGRRRPEGDPEGPRRQRPGDEPAEDDDHLDDAVEHDAVVDETIRRRARRPTRRRRRARATTPEPTRRRRTRHHHARLDVDDARLRRRPSTPPTTDSTTTTPQSADGTTTTTTTTP